ncbi:lyase family protein [Salinibacterium sp. ZJ450]|uniref:lyase family protein n=1 Tax=Salinibacterium sp. ZJ450 TaxID=2708338 RepID=UPI001CD81131|nr:lyase family protein [Salinibacterium sp. ZJ450]
MPSTDDGDFGLLSPVWAGTAVVPLTSDQAVIRAMIDVEIALAQVQAPQNAADAIEAALRGADIHPEHLAVASRGGGNPVIPLLAELRPLIEPDAAIWLHRGATSQDILDTALVIVARDAALLTVVQAHTIAESLIELAGAHVDTLMVGRTITQHATPTTFGLKAAGWLSAVVAAERQLAAAVTALPVQLGGSSGTLASFIELHGDAQPIVGSLAEILDLAEPTLPWHVHRAPLTTLGDALVQLSDALGTIAANVALLARSEIRELSEPVRAGGGGSSAMPHKQNPVLATLISAAALRAPSLAADLHRAAVTVDERPPGAWHSEWSTLRELLRTVGGQAETARELVAGLGVNVQRMRQHVDASANVLVSERLMLRLAPLIGKKAVQQIVDTAVSSGRDIRSILRDEVTLADWSDDNLAELADPAQYTGAAAELVARAIADAREDHA